MQGNKDRRTDELIPSFRPVTYAALLQFTLPQMPYLYLFALNRRLVCFSVNILV